MNGQIGGEGAEKKSAYKREKTIKGDLKGPGNSWAEGLRNMKLKGQGGTVKHSFVMPLSFPSPVLDDKTGYVRESWYNRMVKN